MYKLLLIITLIFSTNNHAVVNDTILLAQLASTTASQLRELTGILKQTKDLSDNFNTVETAIDEKIDLAERIQLQADEIKDLQELSEAKDLETLTTNLKHLKSTVADTNEFVREMKQKQIEAKAKEREIGTEKKHIKKRQDLSGNRYRICSKGNNTGSSTKCTSVNTALILKENQETNKHLVEQKELSNNIYSLELARAMRDRKEKESAKKLVEDFKLKEKKGE
jgi:prophage DNA circulation protein